MQLPGAVSSAVAALVRGPTRPAEVLGVSAAAIYLAAGADDVIAVLAHDAVQLPCGILLPTTSAELPLTSIAPTPGAEVQIGGGASAWPSAAGPVVITIVREWPVVRVGRGRPLAAELKRVRTLGNATVSVFGRSSDGKPTQWTDYLGKGPGLTPAGDDLLAGLLLGREAFGAAEPGVLADAICALAPSRTTAL